MSNWKDYYSKVRNKPVSPILKIACGVNKYKKGIAYDLGAGTGQDALFLAKKGWHVVAVDNEGESIKLIQSLNQKTLKGQEASFENINLEKCHLINGTFSFPFCHPKSFDEFWSELRKALSRGGTLSGQLFGPNDDWSLNTNMNFQTHESWKTLLKGFEIIYFDEVEEVRPTAMGNPKHWHIYSFILKRT